MNLKSFLTAASIAILPLTASAASFIVPAAGTGPGANGSQWQSELTLHNVSASPFTASIIFHDQNGASAPVTVSIAARSTTTLADIVKNSFGISARTGAIEVAVADADLEHLAVSSRTFNTSPSGEFGQDIPAIKSSDAAAPGDLAVLSAPSAVDRYRFNFGVYAVTDAKVSWSLLRADGTVAAQKDVTYSAGKQIQYASGVNTFLGVEPKNDDTLHASVTGGSAIFYGSAVNNASGDPTFVPSVKAREEIRINFVGVDVNGDGVAEAKDADRNGVVDSPVDVFTSTGFPNYFRIIASGEHGEPATFELIDAGTDAMLIDANGTFAWAPNGALRGGTGTLKVRITAGGSTAVVTIPANYR